MTVFRIYMLHFMTLISRLDSVIAFIVYMFISCISVQDISSMIRKTMSVHFFFLIFILFTYLVAPGLSCGRQTP